MRWLAGLAVILVGAAIYLYVAISDGSAKPNPRPGTTEVAAAETDAPSSAPAPTSGGAPKNPVKAPASVPRQVEKQATPSPALAPSPTPSVATEDVAPRKGPAELGDPNVPWTEAERQQWLWTAGGRFEKGNYPGSLEAALEIARRNPNSAWEQDAWSVAIKSYCGLSEPEKAQALFAKMTDQAGIDEAVKRCAEWNIKLTK